MSMSQFQTAIWFPLPGMGVIFKICRKWATAPPMHPPNKVVQSLGAKFTKSTSTTYTNTVFRGVRPFTIYIKTTTLKLLYKTATNSLKIQIWVSVFLPLK